MYTLFCLVFKSACDVILKNKFFGGFLENSDFFFQSYNLLLNRNGNYRMNEWTDDYRVFKEEELCINVFLWFYYR